MPTVVAQSDSGRLAGAMPRPAATAILAAVGFNPFRRHRRRTSDVVMVVVPLLVVVAALVWAALPR